MEIDEWVRLQLEDMPLDYDGSMEAYDYMMAKLGVPGYD